MSDSTSLGLHTSTSFILTPDQLPTDPPLLKPVTLRPLKKVPTPLKMKPTSGCLTPSGLPPEDVRSLDVEAGTPYGLYSDEDAISAWSLPSGSLPTIGDSGSLRNTPAASRATFQCGYSMVVLPGSLDRFGSEQEWKPDL